MEIDIFIDKITDCLIEHNSGRIVDTRYEVRDRRFKPKEHKDWKFDWNKPIDLGFSIYELFTIDSNIVQGRIAFRIDGGVADINIAETAPHNYGTDGRFEGVGAHLFALACQASYDAGCDGYVAFDAKSNLIEHYKETLGAKLLYGIRMVIEEKQAMSLINKYLRK